MDHATLQKKINKKLKKLIYRIGALISIASIFFSFRFVYQYRSEINFFNILRENVITIISIVSVTITINFLLALAWRQILLGNGEKILPKEAISIYGLSQLAKYVPGNFFQFLSRQGIGMASGVNSKALAISSLIEVALLAISGVTFFLVFLIAKQTSLIVAFLIFIAILIFIATAIKLNYNKHISGAFIFYTLFLVCSSVVFIFTYHTVYKGTNLGVKQYLQGAIGYILSWFLGFITPGAPAGIGIRELTLAKTLGPSMSEGTIIALTTISRLISVLSDIFYFLISFWIRRNKKK